MAKVTMSDTIVKVRRMTDKEMADNGWDGYHTNPPVLELEDGGILFPARDEEGNGPGVLFGVAPNGSEFML